MPRVSLSLPLLILLVGCEPMTIDAVSLRPADETTNSASGGTGGAANVDTGQGGAAVDGDVWQLVWSDEFDGTGLPDASRWSFEDQQPGWVNQELQRYTGARTENVRVEGGHLIIEARAEAFDGAEYTSARIHSAGKGTMTYGKVEVRARLPRGIGTWPAIWMMPDNAFKFATTCDQSTGWISGCDAWPNSGEIDIMEHVGHDLDMVHASIHCEAYNWKQPEQRTSTIPVVGATEEFHVYSVERTPMRIVAKVDGYPYFSFENENSGWQTWPFSEPFYVILNIAVGGSWGGSEGVEPADFPAQMLVDYVRIFEAK